MDQSSGGCLSQVKLIDLHQKTCRTGFIFRLPKVKTTYEAQLIFKVILEKLGRFHSQEKKLLAVTDPSRKIKSQFLNFARLDEDDHYFNRIKQTDA